MKFRERRAKIKANSLELYVQEIHWDFISFNFHTIFSLPVRMWNLKQKIGHYIFFCLCNHLMLTMMMCPRIYL